VAGDSLYAYLADGATEALTNGLARLQSSGGVVASASARQVVQTSSDTPTVAQRLGADRVVEGTSFGDGSRVRFEVRLSDPKGRVLWSSRADGAPEEILQLYEMLVVRVAAALGQDLPLERRVRAEAIDPNAQRLLVNALTKVFASAWVGDPQGDLVRAARQALALAPNFADAHRELACTLAELVYFGSAEGSQPAALDEARQHAERAVELDPTSGLAFIARAETRFVGGDRGGAEADFRRALVLAPGSGRVQWTWSWYLSHFGRYDECVAAGDRAAALDPLTPTNASGWCLFAAGRYAEAATKLDTQLVARGYDPHPLVAAAYARAGRVAEARRMRDALVKTNPAGGDVAVDWLLMYVYLAEGDGAGARQIADMWWNKEDNPAPTWGMVAQMYGALDDVDRTVECLLRMKEKCGNPDPCFGGWNFLPDSVYSERVRRDPRLRDFEWVSGEKGRLQTLAAPSG